MNSLSFSRVLVLMARCPFASAGACISQYEAALPTATRTRIGRYVRDHDKALSITGRLLLIDGLNRLGIPAQNDLSVHYPTGERPVLPLLPRVRFSISHSGEWVVCALGQDLEIGVDIEEQKSLNLVAMSRFLTPGEWQAIEEATNPTNLFHTYWTRKEAIIKAANRGAIDQFAAIDTRDPTPRFNDQRWYLSPLDVHPSYICYLATNTASTVQLISLSF